MSILPKKQILDGKLVVRMDTRYSFDQLAMFKFAKYIHDDTLSIRLADYHTGEAIMNVTINVSIAPPEDCIWIKNYAENEGIVRMLIGLDLIYTNVYDSIKPGFVEICAYKMKNELLEEAHKFLEGK